MGDQLTKRKILEMVKNNEISAEQAVQLYEQQDSLAQGQTEAADTNGHLYYQTIWEPSINQTNLLSLPRAGQVLLLACDQNLSLAVQKRFAERGMQVTVGIMHPRYEQIDADVYGIQPENSEDYQRLIGELHRLGKLPDQIIHLWSQSETDELEKNMQASLVQGVYSLLWLTQALIAQKNQKPIRLMYLYTTSEAEVKPEHAAVSGFAKAIRRESPSILCKTVEVKTDRRLQPNEWSELLLEEWQSQTDEEGDVRYEKGRRLIKRLRQYNEGSAAKQPVLKPNGVYLITGGTGGLGLIFANYLAKKVGARLALVGRSYINEGIKGKLQELEQLGAEVVYLQADVSRKEDVHRVVAETKERFGKIHGIIHAAGVLQDSFVLKKTASELEQVFAPKLYGTMYLDEATKHEPLDFFVLFSSITALIGNVGQSDYAFANSFLDHFAKMRAVNNRTGKTLSMNWPFWEEGGMAMDHSSLSFMRHQFGLVPMRTQTGLEAFEAGLSSSLSQLLVVEGDVKQIRRFLEMEKEKEQAEAGADTSALAARDYSDLLEQLELFLKDILFKEIKLPAHQINSSEPLEKYGIDSVMVMNLTRELETHFGELSKTLFFEYQTIRELAEYFNEHHAPKVQKKFGANLLVEETGSKKLDEHANIASPVTLHRFATEKVDKVDKVDTEDGIAIIGVSGRYPKARNLIEFWENLRDGRDCITEIPPERWELEKHYSPDKDNTGTSYSKWGGFLEDIDKFDSLFFSISPREAASLDPQERLFLETVWHTLEDAGYTKTRLSKYHVGVYVGVMYSHYQLYGADEELVKNGFLPVSSFASIANRVSYFLHAHGPSIAVDTMCSSSLTAIHLACESIRRGESEVAIAGGVNLSLHPNKYVQLSQGRFVSSDGKCRSFGEGGDGYVPGEGVGAVLLKPLRRALADGDQIYAVIKGSVINHGGKTNGYTVPNPNAQADLIANAIEKASIDPETISYVEAHGTGTSLGDPIEITGLTKAFRRYTSKRQYCPIGSVKSNIGHLESAAGIAALTKVLLQMKHKQLVPSLHSERANPHIHFADSPFYLQHACTEWEEPRFFQQGKEIRYPRRAAISSFGAGGANAHLVVEEFRLPKETEPSREPHIFVLSAKNEERLRMYAAEMLKFLQAERSNAADEKTVQQELFGKLRADIRQIAASVIKVEETDLEVNEPLHEYGFDQVNLVSVLQQIQEIWHTELEPLQLSDSLTIDALANDVLTWMNRNLGLLENANQEMDTAQTSRVSLTNIVYTLQTGREAMEERLAFIVSSRDELLEKLTQVCQGKMEQADLYRGNAKKSKDTVEMLVEGAEGRQFVQVLMNNKKYKKLAQLWVAGARIEWELLYSGMTPRIVSLPTYPFFPERHWVPEKTKGRAIEADRAASSVLHPLLDQNESTLEEQCFTKYVTAADLFVKDFMVQAEHLLPAGFVAEMVRAAGQLAKPADTVRAVRNLAWAKPLVVEAGSRLKLNLYPQADHVGYEIRMEDDQKQVPCAQGELLFESQGDCFAGNVCYDIEQLKERCLEYQSGQACYQYLRSAHLHVGSGLQAIKEMWSNQSEVLSHLVLPEELIDGSSSYVLHPALLEGAFQMAGAWMNITAKLPLGAYQVASIGEIHIIRPLTHSCYAFAQTTDDLHALDIQLLDRHGQLLARIQKVKLAMIHEAQSVSHPQTKPILLHKAWRQAAIEQALVLPMQGTWVLLANRETIRFADSIRQWNPDVGLIVWQYDVHVASQREVQQIISNNSAINGIIDVSDVWDDAMAEVDHNFGKIQLLQQLIRLNHQQNFYVLHVTSGLHNFQNERWTLNGAELNGLVKMLGAEYRRVVAKTVDVDSFTLEHSGLPLLIQQEIAAKGEDSEVCYRKGSRYVPYLTEVDESRIVQRPFTFAPEKAVVITGGTRGIGFEIAKHILNKGVRKLVLMGRQPLPPRERWTEAIKDQRTDQGVASRIRQFISLEQQGVQLEIYTGSLLDEANLLDFLRKVRGNMGNIGGVIHCAGMVGHENPAFVQKTEQEMRSVFEPKITGLQTLHRLLQDEPLDFFLLFSSVSGTIPLLGAGVSDYACANAFMDHFASYQKSQGHRYYKSIVWPNWKEAGMGEVTTPAYRKTGLTAHSTADGLLLFDRVMAMTEAAVVIPSVLEIEKLDSYRILSPKLEQSASPVAKAPQATQVGTNQTAESENESIEWLKDLFSEQLHIPVERLEDDVPFGDLGVDSVLLVELVRKVEAKVKQKLDPSVFLEYPTLQALGQYLQASLPKERSHADEASDTSQLGVTGTTSENRKSLSFEGEAPMPLRLHAERFSRHSHAGPYEMQVQSAEKIAVIGVACHFPGAANRDIFWNNLAEGKSGIMEVPSERWDVGSYYAPEYEKGKSISKWGGFIEGIEYFDPHYFQINEEDAPQIDPLIRQFMEVSVQTLRDAGYQQEELHNKRVGVFVGSRMSNYMERLPQVSKNSIIGIGQNFIAAHISHFFNFKGPSMVLDTACSSSLVSIHLACNSILSGEAELAIAGGVDILLDEHPYLILSEGRALSPDGKCHTFDAKANGFVPGEGCGAVLLKPLSKALADGDNIYAVIDATAINNDGRTMGITTPNPDGQREVIQSALRRGNIDCRSISYIETHGTGTMIGDPIELKALTKVFHEVTKETQFCAVGSVKSNIGHLLSAAGIASFIKVALSIRHRQLPPTLNCETPNPRFAFEQSPFYPNTSLVDWQPRYGIRRAGISSFGFGGTNAHVIVSELDAQLMSSYRPKRKPLEPIEFRRARYWLEKRDAAALVQSVGKCVRPAMLAIQML